MYGLSIKQKNTQPNIRGDMNKILRIIATRLLLGIVTLWVVSVIIFAAVEALPGDMATALLGQEAIPETLHNLRLELGLYDPMHVRYLRWFNNMVVGDFGKSLSSGQVISDLLISRGKNTAILALYATLVAVPLSLALGIYAALKRNSYTDRAINAFSLISISFPEFFVGYILIYIFTNKLHLFPAISNISSASDLGRVIYVTTLPALTLTLVVLAHMMRMTRAAIINLLASPYIEMAKLKGLSNGRIIMVHALPNALAPIINVVAINIAFLIVGVVVVEVIFVYPGLGQLIVDGVKKRDFPLVQSIALIFAAVYILLNLTADILSIITNPRILHQR